MKKLEIRTIAVLVSNQVLIVRSYALVMHNGADF